MTTITIFDPRAFKLPAHPLLRCAVAVDVERDVAITVWKTDDEEGADRVGVTPVKQSPPKPPESDPFRSIRETTEALWRRMLPSVVPRVCDNRPRITLDCAGHETMRLVRPFGTPPPVVPLGEEYIESSAYQRPGHWACLAPSKLCLCPRCR